MGLKLLKKRKQKQTGGSLRRVPIVEPLEPRILLSADLPGLDTLASHSDAHDQVDVDQVLADANTAFMLATADPDPQAASEPDHDDETADDAVNAVAQAEPLRQELIIVDPSVPGYEILLADVRAVGGEGTELRIEMLDPQRSGVDQITRLLFQYADLDAIHLISHGGDGTLQLGSDTLDQASLDHKEDFISTWGAALSADGDILIYGCNLAASETGEALVNALAELTGADVAASDDLTGHANLGGDWELEFLVGELETPIFADAVVQRDWTGTLDAAEVSAEYLSTPLAFEENSGQFDEPVDYVARGDSYAVFLTDTDAVIRLDGDDGGHVLRLDVVNADTTASVSGDNRLETISNYLHGDDPDGWRTGVENFGAVRYEGVYDGIDLVYYGNQRQLQYDFHVDPGADHTQIRLNFEGAYDLAIGETGELVITLNEAGDHVTFKAPYSYQTAGDGTLEEVASHYVIHTDGTVGFDVGGYDASRELVIDPTLNWASYYGSTGAEVANDVAVDASGNVYIVGDSTTAGSLPAPTAGPLAPGAGGLKDAYVAKFDATGGLVYATYLGGTANETGEALTVDGSGNVYLAGVTASTDFPLVGEYQNSLAGSDDVYLVKLNSTGTSIDYSTYLGGNSTNDESVGGIALDPDNPGRVIIGGSTQSNDLPTKLAYDATSDSDFDGYLAAFDTTTTGNASLVYSTYFGGVGGNTTINDIAVTTGGKISFTGHSSSSTSFPTSANAYDSSLPDNNDAYVGQLSTDGAGSWTLEYSSFLGSPGTGHAEYGEAITVDAAGNIYIAGRVDNGSFPTKNAYDPNYNFSADVFVAKFDPDAVTGPDSLVYSTYFGGSGYDTVTDIAVDADGNLFLTGSTSSFNLPLEREIDNSLDGSKDAYIAVLGPAGNTLEFSTYYGGENDDTGEGIALGSATTVYVTGDTSSSIGVASGSGEYQTSFGGTDGFLARFENLLNEDPVATNNSYTVAEGGTLNGNVISDDTGAGIDSDPDTDPLTASVVDGPLHGTLVLNSDGSFTYTPYDAADGDNFADTDSFTYQVNDGNGGTDTATVTITVTPDATNEAPVHNVPGAQTIGQDLTLVFNDANTNRIVVRDDAGGNTIDVTLTATNGTATLSGTTGLTVSGNGTASVMLSGTLTDINAALDGLTFTPTASYLGAASLRIQTSDNGHSGTGGTLTDDDTISIDVIAINDPPVNSVPAAQTVDQDGMLLFSSATATAISISDPDAGGVDVEVTLTATNGTLNLSGTKGLTFTPPADGTDDASITFTGTVADINAVLEGMTFVATPGFTGAASLQITTDDLGNSGAGGAQSDTDTVAITVQPRDSALWLTTATDETNSGAPGLNSWTGGEVLQFGGSLSLEPGTTSGTFSAVFNLDDPTFGDTDTIVNALHHVGTNIAVGTNAIQLYAGDILLSTQASENLTGLSVSEKSVFVFRP
ncbi:MAG: DUF4347 domain-containing protein, partial [Sedimenticolaceae bacterium]